MASDNAEEEHSTTLQRASILLHSNHNGRHNKSRSAACLQALRTSRTVWLVIGSLSLIVWIFSMVGTFHCSFLMVQRVPKHDHKNSNTTSTTIATSSTTTTKDKQIIDHPVALGLFSTSVYDLDANMLGCVAYYGTSDFDGAFTAARTFGMITALATTVALFCVGLVTLFLEPAYNHWRLPNKLWATARLLLFVAFLSQLLTFLAFGRDFCSRTDMTCRPGAASVLSMLNLIFLGVLSALIYVAPPVATPLFLLQTIYWHCNNSTNNSKPVSIIMMNHDEHVSPDGEGANEKLEILSVQPPSTSSAKAKDRGPRGIGHTPNSPGAVLAENDTGSDLESEHGKNFLFGSQNVVMEGIECVAADHSRRRTWSDNMIINKYFSIGEHPGTRLAIAIILCQSWIFTLVGTTRCTFLLVGTTGQDRSEFNGLGLFNRAYYMHDDILGCVSYPPASKSEFDGAFNVAKAFGMITLLLMTACFLSLLGLHGFMPYSQLKEKIWWGVTQLTIPCAFVTQMITFSAFQTESCAYSDSVECVPGVAGSFAILNVVLLFTLSIFIFALPCPQDPMFRLRTFLPSAQMIKSQVQQYKEQMKQQQPLTEHEEDQGLEVLEEELYQSYPETTGSTYDSSDNHDNSKFDAGVRVRSFAPLDIGESVEVTEYSQTSVEEYDETSTTTKEIIRRTGSKAVTITTDGYTHGTTTSHSSSSTSHDAFATKNSTSNNLEDDTCSTEQVRGERTATSTAPPTINTSSTSGHPKRNTNENSGVSRSTSWDSRASLEQFETTEIMMDTTTTGTTITTNDGSSIVIQKQQQNRANMLKSQCCLVQETAMSIMREMQKEKQEDGNEVERKRQLQILEELTKKEIQRQGGNSNSKEKPKVVFSTYDNSTDASGKDGDHDDNDEDNDAGTEDEDDDDEEEDSDDSSKSSTECGVTSDDGLTFKTGDAVKTENVRY